MSDVRYISREESLRWFREAKLGMFIHWGVYALLEKGEWIQEVEGIQGEEYEKLPPQFTAEKFDPRTWVDLAREAGCRYITFTTKHHDGFCLFNTATTDYNVMNTPCGRDIVRELTEECHRQGLRMHYYYSIMDWHHPDYLPRRSWDKRPADGYDMARYREYMKEQLRELLTQYGPVGCLWYDGGWMHTPEYMDSVRMNAMVREIQPHILINDRAMTPEDFGTPEQRVPATGLTNPDGSPRVWEACLTITSHWWGYDAHETKFKSPAEVLRIFIDVVSKGGNLLLNVGPKPDGTIQDEFVAVFRALGEWMCVNGEAIYATNASPFRRLPFFGRVTRKGNRLYLHVFDWPRDGVLRLVGLKTEATAAWLLAQPDVRLTLDRDGDTLCIRVPASAPDPVASVVAVELAGEPVVEQLVLKPDADGRVNLPALYADVHGPHGQRARLEAVDGVVQVGNWINPRDLAAWDFELPEAGEYEVTLNYACPPEQAGATVAAVSYPDERFLGRSGPEEIPDDPAPTVTGTVAATASATDFQRLRLGKLSLPAGKSYLVVKALEMPNGAVMNLRGVELTQA